MFKRKSFKYFILLLISIVFTNCKPSCNTCNTNSKDTGSKPVSNKEAEKASDGFDISQIDNSVKPSTDFYEYAVGGWLKNNKIPPEYSTWGTFSILHKKTENQLKALLTDIEKEKNLKSGSIKQKVRDFYAVGMDQNKADDLGVKPLQNVFDKIDNIKSKDELVNEVAYIQEHMASPMFSMGAEQDLKDSGMMIFGLMQGGIGLPYKEYYLSDKKHPKQLRKDYRQYIKDTYKILGLPDKEIDNKIKTIMKIETVFARASRSPVELRDPDKNYNPMTIEELTKTAPNFNWSLFFKDIKLNDLKKINVGQPEFFENLSAMMSTVTLDEWKVYLKWTVLRSVSPYLSESLVKANFEFYGKNLQGTEKMKPLWKRVIATENLMIGEALGQIYVEKYFPPENKKKAEEIVENLLKSMKHRIENLSWMTETTKKKALEKLAVFTVKIGYPGKWINYSTLDIKNDSYIENYIRAYYFNAKRDLDKVGKPTDRSEWHMNPQTVNAYYNPCSNEIVFPAAILQPPFFNINADDAINYGSMGVVIGHEITHGFDDQGSKFDKEGNLNKWWTPKDKEQFEERTKKLVEQFDKYEPLKGYNVDGELTLGENIADLGGLAVSYDAFKMTKEYKEGKKIDGFTPQQRFFLGLAQMWRFLSRDQAKILRLKDVHSPPKIRVDGSVTNFTPFYKAFNIESNTPMYKAPKDRIVIW